MDEFYWVYSWILFHKYFSKKSPSQMPERFLNICIIYWMNNESLSYYFFIFLQKLKKYFLISAAKYFDEDGLDTPLGHPSLPDETRCAQKISDIMLDVTFSDLGNNKRVSHIFMTFGQFMDHDFAYVIHGPSSLCPET